MDEFMLWFSTGFYHIVDLAAYDHILYLISLCILFNFKDWKQLLVLITGFTIGHSLTLAFSAMNLVNLDPSLVEIAIATTISITCIFNLKQLFQGSTYLTARYLSALGFGCIHGLGFSVLLKALLGKEVSILFPLFSFNLGIEAGQILIVIVLLGFLYCVQSLFKKFEKIILSTITFVILLVSLYLILERI